MTKKPSRLAKELLETAEGIHDAGLLGRTTYDKITMRHLARRTCRGLRRSPLSRYEPCESMRT